MADGEISFRFTEMELIWGIHVGLAMTSWKCGVKIQCGEIRQ